MLEPLYSWQIGIAVIAAPPAIVCNSPCVWWCVGPFKIMSVYVMYIFLSLYAYYCRQSYLFCSKEFT